VAIDSGRRLTDIRGANYVPSNAVNATEMWLEFDAATIDRELGFAEALGLNSLRVFLQYIVHDDDAASLLERFDEPQAGDASVALLHDVFAWARHAAPSQPLTASWAGTLLSDVTSIHFYVSPAREPDEARLLIETATPFGRPVIVTETLGRPNHGELHEILPLFREHELGWYVWELMIGADQTRYQWPDALPAPDDVVFQGLLYPDGTPYSDDEARLIRALDSGARVE
jgi:hypothetical protein